MSSLPAGSVRGPRVFLSNPPYSGGAGLALHECPILAFGLGRDLGIMGWDPWVCSLLAFLPLPAPPRPPPKINKRTYVCLLKNQTTLHPILASSLLRLRLQPRGNAHNLCVGPSRDQVSFLLFSDPASTLISSFFLSFPYILDIASWTSLPPPSPAVSAHSLDGLTPAHNFKYRPTCS